MSSPLLSAEEIAQAIRNVPDFPKPGIQFKDITPVLADPRLFAGSIDLLLDGVKPGSVKGSEYTTLIPITKANASVEGTCWKLGQQ